MSPAWFSEWSRVSWISRNRSTNLQPWSYFRQQLHTLTHFSGYSAPSDANRAHANTFSFLEVCSASPSLCRAAYLTSRNAIVLQLRSRQACGYRLTVGCITSEWVVWVSLRVCEGFFSSSSSFPSINVLSQIRKCDAVTVQKETGTQWHYVCLSAW